MQLLDDDMDELFRNAASQYPLKTDGADWDALSARLQESGQVPGRGGSGSSVKWYRWALVLLLCLVSFLLFVPVIRTGKKPVNGSENENTKVSVSNNSEASEKATRSVADVTENNSTTASNNTIKVPEASTDKTIHNAKPTNNNTSSFASAQDMHNGHTTVNSEKPAPGEQHQVSHPQQAVDHSTPTGLSLDGTTAAVPASLTVDALAGQSVDALAGLRATDPAVDARLHHRPQAKDSVTPVKEKAPAPKVKGFYAGFVVSPDISTVRFQSAKKVGYGAGLIAGYRISRRLAVETGLLWERKNYYTQGEYFNKSKLPFPSNWKINTVDGYCNMFELPVNIRYYFSLNEKSSWYANVGMSSYIMKKEDYAFNYDGGSGAVTKDWAYLNSSKNWFSVVHVGVGYEKPIGLIGNLRVEPYVNLPAAGVGMGKLPLTSVGLNIGITKTIR
jgi:cytoskeletal protein RodZ